MKICVLGTGTMGSGIVQMFAQSGREVWMKGRSQSSVDRAMGKIDGSLSHRVAKGKMTQESKDEVMTKIHTTLSFDEIKDSDLFIEAIAEDMATKKEMFGKIDEIAKPEAILATNTSSLSITAIGAATKCPQRVVGMHFFNPVPTMKLVEIVKGQLTSEETLDKVFTLAQEINKTPVRVNEAPGFIVNRMLIPMINEGIGVLADGVATREEIDAAMKLGANHPMGPLELADLIGLDVCLAIMEVLYKEFCDDKYRPHPLLRKMVRANQLGRKTGVGFYDYRKK